MVQFWPKVLLLSFNKNKIERQIEKIFQDEKQQSKKDQELKKWSTKARMNLEAITKLRIFQQEIDKDEEVELEQNKIKS